MMWVIYRSFHTKEEGGMHRELRIFFRNDVGLFRGLFTTEEVGNYFIVVD